MDAVIEHTAALSALFRKALTWGQGIEMARHHYLIQAADINIYFAHLHRLKNETRMSRRTSVIRRDVPKSAPVSVEAS